MLQRYLAPPGGPHILAHLQREAGRRAATLWTFAEAHAAAFREYT